MLNVEPVEHSHFMKSECGVWARVEINSEPNKRLRLTPPLASRKAGTEKLFTFHEK